MTDQNIKKDINLKIYEIETLKGLYETASRSLKRSNRFFYKNVTSFLEQEKEWNSFKEKNTFLAFEKDEETKIEAKLDLSMAKGRIALPSWTKTIFDNIEEKREQCLKNDLPVLGSFLERVYKDEDPDEDLSESWKQSKVGVPF